MPTVRVPVVLVLARGPGAAHQVAVPRYEAVPGVPAGFSYSAPTVDGEAQVERRSEPTAGGEFGIVGRNAPCPCGSGRKYKLCHGDPRNRLFARRSRPTAGGEFGIVGRNAPCPCGSGRKYKLCHGDPRNRPVG